MRHPRRVTGRPRPRLWAAVVFVLAASFFAASHAAFASDSNGFDYGTDSHNPYNISGSNPYTNYFAEKNCSSCSYYDYRSLGGNYGGYFGRLGGYWTQLGCTVGNQWNQTDVNRSYSNDINHNIGVGPVQTWWLGGPGRDPTYHPSTYSDSKGHAWGVKQANDAINVWDNHSQVLSTVIFADMEGSGEGWNHYNYAGCGLNASYGASGIPTRWDRAVINGWQDGLKNASYTSLLAGVYASHWYWNSETFACGSCTSGDGYIPSIYKWTYENTNGGTSVDCTPSTSCEPKGNWTVCDPNSCVSARWFGGGATDGSGSHELVWQWATPSGTTGGDFDQVDSSRMRSLQI